jgi:hypothetical protein
MGFTTDPEGPKCGKIAHFELLGGWFCAEHYDQLGDLQRIAEKHRKEDLEKQKGGNS